MNILVACDSFKDALSSLHVCKAIERGLISALPSAQIKLFPISDAGEGLTEILSYHLNLNKVEVYVCDPLGRKISTSYCMTHDNATAYIEMAQASGLQLLDADERNPMLTSTYGFGEIIKNAISKGANSIVLGIGGSSTNDLGLGMASALGWKFLDANNNELPAIGKNLNSVQSIVAPLHDVFRDIEVIVMSDVNISLLGDDGAAHTYAKQKGASESDILNLEAGALHLANIIPNGKEIANLKGSGAAGGMGFGAVFFLKAKISSGINSILDIIRFDEEATWADYIITGEGRLDHQTLHGKLINGVVSRAKSKPVIALCGAIDASIGDINTLGLRAAFAIGNKPSTIQEAIKATAQNLERTAFNLGKLIAT